jgi:RNA polymerase sigma-B factor
MVRMLPTATPRGTAQGERSADPATGLLRIEVDVRGAVATVRADGEIDLSTRAHVAAALATTAQRFGDPDEPVRDAVVDLRAVSFADAATAEVLARFAGDAQAQGVRVRVLPGEALADVVAPLGGWAALAPAVVVADDADAAEGGSDGPSSEYAHLMPLFGERDGLPAGHPRRGELRSRIIAGYLPVARHIARKHSRRGESLEDLEQVATVGLINAVDRFEVGRGFDFLAFAIPTITGEVQRHFRDRTSTIRMPRRVRELQSTVLRAVDELQGRDGRSPRPSEIARYLDVELGDVIEALEANHRSYCASLDEPFPGSEQGAENVRFVGALGVADQDLGLVDDRESLAPLLDALPERERRIVLLRFYGNLTQSQIATDLGISQMHVSRLLTATLGRMREAMEGRRPLRPPS